jgi:hypothetical protein
MQDKRIEDRITHLLCQAALRLGLLEFAPVFVAVQALEFARLAAKA